MAISVEKVPQAQVFQASAHKGVERFSILEKKVNSIFNKILYILAYIPKALYNGVHGLIGKAAYPAPAIYSQGICKSDIDYTISLYTQQAWKDKRVQFKAADGADLEGVFFKSSEKSDITMIYYLGNSDNCFNRFPENIQKLAEQLNVNILMFNYRDNYPSKGAVSKEGLILDGDAAFQYVQSLGYQEQNIILHGHSLGGAIAAQVAAMHPNVNYCNDRSFSKLTTEIKQLFGGGILGTILSTVAHFFNWELNTLAAWDKITGHKWIIYNQADGVIKYGARLGEHFEGKEFVLDTFYKKGEQAYFYDKEGELPTLRFRSLSDYRTEEEGLGEHCFNIFDQEDGQRFYKQQIAAIAQKQVSSVATAVA